MFLREWPVFKTLRLDGFLTVINSVPSFSECAINNNILRSVFLEMQNVATKEEVKTNGKELQCSIFR